MSEKTFKMLRAWMPQRADAAAYVQARAEERGADGSYWVDFEVFIATGWDGTGGPAIFNDWSSGGAPSAPLLSGFCKSDGCMQWGVLGEPLQFHVDHDDAITVMHDALLLARELARQLVSSWLNDDEPRRHGYEMTDERVEDRGGESGWKP
jgi:hypothetical protein